MDRITFLGDERQTGAYVLWMSVNEALRLSFGRFRGGLPVTVAAGQYAYVGSAMGRSGVTAPAGRLLRHATRSPGKPPHAIRDALAAALGVMGATPRPPATKRLHWHIDYLLDEMAVELTSITVVHTGRRVESELARRLVALPGVEPLLPGLGAADAPGETHLLRVEDAARTRQLIEGVLATLIDPSINDPFYNRL
ncbi:MAG TPA: DUF123 domain-containing protein, partial [Promineifilum sp.]|nr:DUF123 domain-containing protein [Promineifilum sp.]